MLFRKGSTVPFPEAIQEGYCAEENYATANVSAEKIMDMMAHFVSLQESPVFFILELPSNLRDETVIPPDELSVRHKDVYYIDGCTHEEAAELLACSGELLVNDGMCAFGFGGHRSGDEIMVGKYNVMTLFSRQISRYDDFFEMHGIPRMTQLTTARDTFTHEHPGQSEIVETEGATVYDLPERYASWGMYRAEQREET